MRKIACILAVMAMATFAVVAQKYALVDMEYILKKIPDYEMMNEQLETISKKYQQEISKLENDAEAKYKKYQSDLVFLSAEQKKQREAEIVKIEQKAAELQGKYFGPEGELFKKRTDMMKPIQDEIWEAIKELAKENSLQLVMDKSTSGIIFANPAIDISDLVLKKMGFGR